LQNQLVGYSKTRQMSKIQWVQHINVSNAMLCSVIYCVKQNAVSTFVFNIHLYLLLSQETSEIVMIQLIYCFLYRFSLDIVNFPIKQTKQLDTS
jgi:hypothetical protein